MCARGDAGISPIRRDGHRSQFNQASAVHLRRKELLLLSRRLARAPDSIGAGTPTVEASAGAARKAGAVGITAAAEVTSAAVIMVAVVITAVAHGGGGHAGGGHGADTVAAVTGAGTDIADVQDCTSRIFVTEVAARPGPFFAGDSRRDRPDPASIRKAVAQGAKAHHLLAQQLRRTGQTPWTFICAARAC
jgi:hypothetical protein